MTSPRARPLAITDASVGGGLRTVIIEDGVIIEIGAGTPRGLALWSAGGGAVLPGLWDHHVHLYASAARAASVDLSRVGDVDEFVRALAEAVGVREREMASARQPPIDGRSERRWVRAVGYDETTLEALTAQRLDALIPTRVPVRVQHRSGHQWVLNGAAVRELRQLGESVPDDGTIWDDRMLRALRSEQPPLADLARVIRARGVVGVTDMSVTTDAASASGLRAALDGTLQVEFFGSPAGSAEAGVKIIVPDNVAPDPDAVTRAVAAARPRPVALHAVTQEALAIASWVLSQFGQSGDRIEHAFLCPHGLIDGIPHGVAVGAHPGFIRTHGDRILRMLPDEAESYQPLASWQAAGITLYGGTDMPFAPADPWVAMAAAVDRRTQTGAAIALDESLTPEAAFALFARGGLRGEVTSPKPQVGDPADLCVIDRPWASARTALDEVGVRATVSGGLLRVHQA